MTSGCEAGLVQSEEETACQGGMEAQAAAPTVQKEVVKKMEPGRSQ